MTCFRSQFIYIFFMCLCVFPLVETSESFWVVIVGKSVLLPLLNCSPGQNYELLSTSVNAVTIVFLFNLDFILKNPFSYWAFVLWTLIHLAFSCFLFGDALPLHIQIISTLHMLVSDFTPGKNSFLNRERLHLYQK